MPIYDYLCSSCGERTEVIHGIDAPGPRFCPVCGAEGTLRKAFAPPAVHFKGSGWAKKDRSASRTKVASKPDAGSEGAKAGTTSESPAGASTATEAGSTTTSGSASGSAASSADASKS